MHEGDAERATCGSTSVLDRSVVLYCHLPRSYGSCPYSLPKCFEGLFQMLPCPSVATSSMPLHYTKGADLSPLATSQFSALRELLSHLHRWKLPAVCFEGEVLIGRGCRVVVKPFKTAIASTQ
jgi:hypothetical protein